MGVLTAEWRINADGELRAFIGDTEAGWAPQPGSQLAFLTCPYEEVLLEGNRGGGKTDVLLMDFAQHVGKGFGPDWRGILFRQTYPQLSEVIQKSKRWFPIMFPEATYNEGKSTWTWPSGESLRFAYMLKPADYWNYHGHSYPWIAWEELTMWSSPDLYLKMFACWRSPIKAMPRKIRGTTNPYGVGHNWVKERFRLPVRPGKMMGPKIVYGDKKSQIRRIAVHSSLLENKILLHADPSYIDKIAEAARNPSELAAWLEGDWNIVAGGMFDDVWAPETHIIDPFKIPENWRLDRSFDWGSSSPYSVGFWAESDGTEAPGFGWTRRGDLFRVGELYGWNGHANEGLRQTSEEIASEIKIRENQLFGDRRVKAGPADNQIFAKDGNQKSIAGEMARKGVRWTDSDKAKDSRKLGWEKIRSMLRAATNPRREEPGLFVFSNCEHFIRTIPILPRADRDLDDIPKEGAEDHVADETRYRVFHRRRGMMTKTRKH